LPYYAALLTDILLHPVTIKKLFADTATAKQDIRELEKAHFTRQPVTIKYLDYRRTVSVGLTPVGLAKLRSAYEELEHGDNGQWTAAAKP
jgi:hypothetical protein